MGIELPVELRGVAERTGTHWPEADEDAMRRAAAAWRRAAESLDRLAAASDASAGGALAAIEGETARAASGHWQEFVEPDTGRLPGSARDCAAAADRLDHAADQVGAAKVRIVRELVTLAKRNDAAERAAAAGNPSAVLRAESAVGEAAGNIAELNRALVGAVAGSGGITIDSSASPGSAPPGSVSLGGSDTGGEPAGAVANPVPDVSSVGDAVSAAGAVAEGALGAVGTADAAGVDGAEGAVGEAVARAASLPASPPARADEPAAPGQETGQHGEPNTPRSRISELLSPDVPGSDERGPVGEAGPAGAPPHANPAGEAAERELTGPVSPETVRRAAGPAGGPDAGTGPIPVVDPAAHSSGESPASGAGGEHTDAGRDPITAPQAVHQAWASPAAAPPPAPPGAAPPPPAGPAPQPGAVSQGPTGQPGMAGQPGPAGSPQRPGAPPPPAPGVGRGVGQPDPGQATQRPAPPLRGGYQPTGVAHPGAAPPVGRNPFAPGGGMSQQQPSPPHPAPQHPAPQHPAPQHPAPQHPAPQHPAQPPQPEGRRPMRENQRDPAVVAFVLHQFPLGHMPVAETRPSRQWSPSGQPSERDTFTVPPQRHPRADLVEEFAHPPSRRAASFGWQAGRTIPAELLVGYEPLGPEAEVGEFEWERRYLLPGPGGNRTHAYDWPVRHGFADNGVEEPDPEVLPPGTLLDRLGDEWGLVLAPEGTAFADRSLPPEFRERAYRRYRVVHPLPVWLTRAVAWFEQPGTGLRYRTTHPLAELLALGLLVDPAVESEQDSEPESAIAAEKDSASPEIPAEPHEAEQTVRIRSNDMSSADDPAGAMR
ncbi:glycohydrolase toxin TNT-related protein [Actinopolyspora sp. H202]|uniref:glycohydrolase toxin TNT-related protein n=1 Tax=Actinopolyspora sp. H202 TaxID=1500456 RepID=UPI003EE5A585